MGKFKSINQIGIVAGFFILLMAITLFQSFFVIIEAGHVGVIKTLGAVQGDELPEGFHFKKPIFDVVEQMDIRLTSATANAASASKDLQIVQTQVTLQFSINGTLAPLIFQKVGMNRKVSGSIIEPAIQESVKAVTAKYTAEQLVTSRAEVKIQIQKAIENFVEVTLEEKGLANAVTIANIAITDFAFSNEFNRAIELKVKAEQEALQAKNEKIRRTTQAEAAATEKKLAAEAEAFQIEVASIARAEAIEREAKALKDNPALIKLRIAEQWDGVLPKFTGEGAIPLLDINSIDKK